ncbi:uncharacterized protein BXZ73DRAFT_44162 [Epithele typhae]|uniref:uncharacterized protein n=1 Tax=Epithele typhae TaxID=378194 RepID=UPI00200765FB|nr:uncharacterized protein BXZ73DRAFT_44162 [Epithele typhae]KAH9939048.1 hypothetical protein BXZ73DRAFT_44162 [Epithele typhae]
MVSVTVGWYERDGQRVAQLMVFGPDGDASGNYRNEPRGMKDILMERGLWRQGLLMKCGGANKCADDATSCCATRILSVQDDFRKQKSLVEEILKAEGKCHICIFLLKYHCEINFIEYFWGIVKRWLREHCDYSFDTIRANMPTAMASVPVELIRKWEHRAWRFIDAYTEGLDAKDAQAKVKQFSSRQYKSHRRIPDTVAQALDQ